MYTKARLIVTDSIHTTTVRRKGPKLIDPKMPEELAAFASKQH